MFECLVQVENGVLGTVEIANIICKQLLMSQRFELLHPTADRERERERWVDGGGGGEDEGRERARWEKWRRIDGEREGGR